MKIICDTCGAKYSIADEKVRGKVFKIRCKKCSEIIVVRGTTEPQQAAAAPAAQEPAGDYGAAGYGPDAAIWHVVLDGEQQGPYTAEQVGQFVAAGQLDYESYCWRDGFADWAHLRDIEELTSAMGGVPQQAAAEGAAFQDQMPTVGAGPEDPYAAQYGQEQMGAYGAEEPGPFDGADTVLAPQEPAGFTAPESAPAAATAQEAVADLFGGQPGAEALAQQAMQQPMAAAEPHYGDVAAGAGAGFAAPSAAPQAARGAADPGADLFAQQDDAAGMFPTGGSEDVMTSSPRVDVGRMTGTRNENSVLFSLSNLQALASGGAGGAAAAPPVGAMPSPASFGGPGATTATAEGSGLIDIKAMAAAASDAGDGVGGSVDDLLSIGGGGGFAPTLGAPVLMAQPQERSNKLVIALVAVGALVVIAVAVVVVVLVTRPTGGPDDAVATADQPVLAPQVGGQPAGDQPAGTVPGVATPGPEGAGAASGEGAGEDEGSEDEGEGGGEGGSRRGGRGKRGGGGGGGGGHHGGGAAEEAPSAASAAPAGGGSASKGSRDLDDLLAGAIGGGGGGGGAKAAPPPAAESGGDPSLPAKLSRSQVQAGMRRVAGAVSRCGRGESGRVTVNIVISGSTGRVSSAEVSGSFAGTAVGSCAARAVRGARFPRFRDKSLTVRGYPFVLR